MNVYSVGTKFKSGLFVESDNEDDNDDSYYNRIH